MKPPRQGSQGDGDAERAPLTAATYTVDEVLDSCTGSPRRMLAPLLMLLYCGLSWSCDAMEVMILSYLGPSAKCEWGLTLEQESGLNSMVFAGMTLGAPVWGMVSDAYGRKTSFALATLISTVFGLATAGAPNYAALMAFRGLVGFGIPAATVAFNLVLEFTPTPQRGLFAVGIEGFWTIGTVVQAGLAYAMLNSHGWRVMVLVSTLPYVVLLLLLPFVPESPRYLLVKGKLAAAEKVLARVARVSRLERREGQLAPLLAPEAGAAAAERAQQAQPKGCAWAGAKARQLGASFLSGVRQLLSRQLWLTTLILIFLWVVAAHVYYGLVLLVSQVDFVESGTKACVDGRLAVPTADLTAILITSSAEVPGLLVSLVLVHTLSRKLAFAGPMVLIPAVLIPLMAGVSGAGAIACMWLSRFFIYMAFNILWTLTPEYYPTSVRSFGLGVSNAFSRIGGLLATYTAVNARASGWKNLPECIFAVLSLLAAALIYLLPPDKKGRHLEDRLEEVDEVPDIQRAASSLITRRGSSSLGSSSIRAQGGSLKARAGAAKGGAGRQGSGGVAAPDASLLGRDQQQPGLPPL